jgi:hypothetical protein
VDGESLSTFCLSYSKTIALQMMMMRWRMIFLSMKVIWKSVILLAEYTCIWHECMTLLQQVICWIKTNDQYNTVELCMYLHANRLYSCSYSTLLHEGIHTKIICALLRS